MVVPRPTTHAPDATPTAGAPATEDGEWSLIAVAVRLVALPVLPLATAERTLS